MLNGLFITSTPLNVIIAVLSTAFATTWYS